MLILIFKKTLVATPLYIASQNGHIDTVALLLKADANPNLQERRSLAQHLSALLVRTVTLTQLTL